MEQISGNAWYLKLNTSYYNVIINTSITLVIWNVRIPHLHYMDTLGIDLQLYEINMKIYKWFHLDFYFLYV